MLAVLLSELEKPESRDVEWDGVPSVLESSSEYRCLSSKAGTVRMVEFMRFGRRGDKVEADVAGTVFPLAPLVVVRDMAELMVPPEAGVRVDRGEGRSCKAFGTLLGVGLLGVVAGVVDGVRTVTDERPGVIPTSASVGSLPEPARLRPRSLRGRRVDSMACHRRQTAAIQTRHAAIPKHRGTFPEAHTAGPAEGIWAETQSGG